MSSVFKYTISNLEFLARQGHALHGNGNERDSNFYQLLRLCTEDESRVFEWFEKRQINTHHQKYKMK